MSLFDIPSCTDRKFYKSAKKSYFNFNKIFSKSNFNRFRRLYIILAWLCSTSRHKYMDKRQANAMYLLNGRVTCPCICRDAILFDILSMIHYHGRCPQRTSVEDDINGNWSQCWIDVFLRRIQIVDTEDFPPTFIRFYIPAYESHKDVRIYNKYSIWTPYSLNTDGLSELVQFKIDVLSSPRNRF